MALCSVACKIPNGLNLRVFQMVDHDEPVMGGGTKTVKRAQQIGEIVKVHGPATPFGQAPLCPISGGYAITRNIDADFFALWLSQNADHDAVKNNLIRHHEKYQNVHDEAKAFAKTKSGLEPIDPASDSRIPGGNRNLGKFEAASDK